jgi:hypothetical protein
MNGHPNQLTITAVGSVNLAGGTAGDLGGTLKAGMMSITTI